jgi:hypothetical protein
MLLFITDAFIESEIDFSSCFPLQYWVLGSQPIKGFLVGEGGNPYY